MVNECRLAMLIPRMVISTLMVHSEQIEEQKLRQVDRDSKRSRPDEGSYFKASFEVQDKPRFKNISSNPSPSNAPRTNQGKMATPKP